MDAGLNATSLTFGGHVELSKYRYLYFVVMFVVYILIVCSNATIVCLIRIHKNLHEPMYIFIAALSVNSLLFSTAIYPKLLIDFVSQTQIITYSACLFQLWLFYSVAASDFLLLAAMAYDRYVSICKPLQYPTIMRNRTVCVLLSVAWLLPACDVVVIVVTLGNKKLCRYNVPGIFCNNTVSILHCVTSRAIEIYVLFLFLQLILLPVIFILFTYTKIFVIAHRSSGEVRKKATETCLPHLLVLLCFSCLFAYDVLVLIVIEFSVPKIIRLIITLQVFLYNPLFNPIIYGLKMKEISKHLKRLFCKLTTH